MDSDRGPNPKLELHPGHLSASLSSLQKVAESLIPPSVEVLYLRK